MLPEQRRDERLLGAVQGGALINEEHRPGREMVELRKKVLWQGWQLVDHQNEGLQWCQMHACMHASGWSMHAREDAACACECVAALCTPTVSGQLRGKRDCV